MEGSIVQRESVMVQNASFAKNCFQEEEQKNSLSIGIDLIETIIDGGQLASGRKTGKIKVGLSSATTTSIKPGRYVYDVLLTDGVGTVTRVVEGSVLVRAGVTK